MLRAPDGTERAVKSKQILRDVAKGTVLVQTAGGGGGYGDPFERPPELVAEEVHNGLITTAAAARDYGVAVSADGEIDRSETAALRRTAR